MLSVAKHPYSPICHAERGVARPHPVCFADGLLLLQGEGQEDKGCHAQFVT
jgi:hypothetical protein